MSEGFIPLGVSSLGFRGWRGAQDGIGVWGLKFGVSGIGFGCSLGLLARGCSAKPGIVAQWAPASMDPPHPHS